MWESPIFFVNINAIKEGLPHSHDFALMIFISSTILPIDEVTVWWKEGKYDETVYYQERNAGYVFWLKRLNALDQRESNLLKFYQNKGAQMSEPACQFCVIDARAFPVGTFDLELVLSAVDSRKTIELIWHTGKYDSCIYERREGPRTRYWILPKNVSGVKLEQSIETLRTRVVRIIKKEEDEIPYFQKVAHAAGHFGCGLPNAELDMLTDVVCAVYSEQDRQKFVDYLDYFKIKI